MLLLVVSHHPHKGKVKAIPRVAGDSEITMDYTSSLQRLLFMKEIDSLTHSRIAFKNASLMTVIQANTVAISLWPLSELPTLVISSTNIS